MKFFILTCLLAVALAKHKTEKDSSSEESVSISQEESAEVPKEKVKSAVEKMNYLQQLNKINQFYRNLNFLQYLQASQQHQIVMNPWDQIKTRAYPFIPTVNREQLSISEETPKTVDMNKISQSYQKFTLPQYLKTVPPYQTTTKPWNQIKINAYQIIPILRHL
ncbi:alpha-S2-casein-like isoform X2 [Ailuropoda melanoleuca]|uniref:alpha-S2-casein-like isoform X2 n=1 Tax=Ailuropoda melanoleuca TaxID=9646 RepID=UPI000947CA10|nr:alpha-S2-casein-like isoform X2 [Ailuropoda melanoleuca]